MTPSHSQTLPTHRSSTLVSFDVIGTIHKGQRSNSGKRFVTLLVYFQILIFFWSDHFLISLDFFTIRTPAQNVFKGRQMRRSHARAYFGKSVTALAWIHGNHFVAVEVTLLYKPTCSLYRKRDTVSPSLLQRDSCTWWLLQLTQWKKKHELAFPRLKIKERR